MSRSLHTLVERSPVWQEEINHFDFKTELFNTEDTTPSLALQFIGIFTHKNINIQIYY